MTGRDDASVARITPGCGPVIAVALHCGHAVRPDLAEYFEISESDRLREEDPHTASMAPKGMPVIRAVRSRFEVDLNRPRERAVYCGPEDAWGLPLYAHPLPGHMEIGSLKVYDDFYDRAYRVLSEAERTHGRFVVLDLHSYNHRRDGVHAAPAPSESNPEVNLGTGRFDRDRWSPVVDCFKDRMSASGFDCRENVKFSGGHFSRWVSDNFKETGVALAIEFKKTYMDEWTGSVDTAAVARIRRGLQAATLGIEGALVRGRSGNPGRVRSIGGWSK